MSRALVGMAMVVVSVVSGCAYETRNREVSDVRLTGYVEGQALDAAQSSRLIEERVRPEFAYLTVVQHTEEGSVELMLSFDQGIDDVIDEVDNSMASVGVLARVEDGSGFGRTRAGQILSIGVYPRGTEEILTTDIRGVREYFDLYLLVEFERPGSFTPISEPAAPHPQQAVQQVEVGMGYVRERVRQRPQERSSGRSTSWDDDEC